FSRDWSSDVCSSDLTDDEAGQDDSALFWPIGQEILADLCRGLLNLQDTPAAPTAASVKKVLSGVGDLTWDFHTPPWRHLLLIPRSEERRVGRAGRSR